MTRSGWHRPAVLRAALALAAAGCAFSAAVRTGPALVDRLCTAARPMFSSPAATGTSGAGARPATSLRVVSCEAVADAPGKSRTTVVVTFPPGAYTPAHRHPGTVTAQVLRGTVRSQMAGTPAQAYRAGMSWFEPAQALHLFAENPSPTETAELLAVFIADSNCGPLVIPEPSSPQN